MVTAHVTALAVSATVLLGVLPANAGGSSFEQLTPKFEQWFVVDRRCRDRGTPEDCANRDAYVKEFTALGWCYRKHRYGDRWNRCANPELNERNVRMPAADAPL